MEDIDIHLDEVMVPGMNYEPLCCPRCAHPLLFAAAGPGWAAMGCDRCEGLWLDNTSARIALRHPPVHHALPIRVAQREQAPVGCLVCGDDMELVDAGAALTSVCAPHGLWLARGQLRLLWKQPQDAVSALLDRLEGRGASVAQVEALPSVPAPGAAVASAVVNVAGALEGVELIARMAAMFA